MKKVLIIATIFIFVGCPLVFTGISEARQKIRIGYFNVPPFIIYDIEENVLTGGALYEFLEQHLGPKIGVEFIWDRSPTTIPRQLKSISSGSIDAIALLSYTPQRDQKMAFTADPFFISSPAIAVLKINKLDKIEKIEDILSLRIGYAQSAYLTPFMQDKRIHYDFVSTGNYNELNFKKLIANRIDAVYTPDMASLLAVIKKLGIKNQVKVIKLPDKTSANHVVFSKNMKGIAKRYDQAFQQIDGANTFLKIMSKYIDISMLR
jgi:polar amino acid transport system substrate-binding protein